MTRSPNDTRLAAALFGQVTPLTDAVAKTWREAGWWEERTIRSLLTKAAGLHPDRVALVGRRSDGSRSTRTYKEFDQNATRAADALFSLGIGPGDVVAVMLPNWVEYPEVAFGINELGAVYVGIPVSYGELQAAPILRRSQAKAIVIPRQWRSQAHLEMSRSLRAEIPTLQHVIVVDDALSPDSLESGEVLWAGHTDVAPHGLPAPDPSALCYLGFTSGTTGEPKGAMHNHNTLVYSVRTLVDHIGSETFGAPAVQLVASPAGHHTGYVWGILLTVLVAGTGVYVDRWEPKWGVQVIREENVTTFFGAPTFLQDMLQTDLAGDPDCPLACVVVAGASVPRNLPESAQEALGAYIAPAWGMTECSIIVSCTPREPAAIQRTDGSVLEGSRVRLVDRNGKDTRAGEVGDLLIHGPAVTLGYFDRPDATSESFVEGLWFRTGDLASIDDHGWVSLAGRTKDIVIRGGENIPVSDIESVLFDHPDVVNVAVVGLPDDRLGERVCAALVLKPDRPEPTLESLSDYLLDRGLSKHYLPERVVCLPELPMTPSGKIQKFRLRELLT